MKASPISNPVRAAWRRVVLGLAACLVPSTLGTAAEGPKDPLWSVAPLVRPAVPPSSRPNPIDAFVDARLAREGLQAAPEADRATLVRRLSFDLGGLPPTPEEVDAFVRDTDPLAYERLVDRLLASPRHGERWARHWLDVVHFGESHGYDKDKPRPNAWPYRDYVIRAFNEDRPWARFIQEQVAGDVLFPGTRDGIEGLGFIAAGPWDFIGHAEVPESKIDGQVARHLDRDDMVGNTVQSFDSLTVQCAQCHNHKFDPISQEDYYALQAVFAAVDRTDFKYDLDPAVAGRRAALAKRRSDARKRGAELAAAIAARAGEPLKEAEKSVAAAEKQAPGSEAAGYHTQIEPRADVAKWVQVDLGKPVALSRIVLHPCHDDFNGIGDGFGFPVRYKIEVSDDPGFAAGTTVVVDRTAADVPNPRVAAVEAACGGRTARHVRVTATRLVARQNDYIFALAELEALDASGANAARGGAVTALDSIEAGPRWQTKNLTDGWYPGVRGDGLDLAAAKRKRDGLLAAATRDDERAEQARIERELADVTAAEALLPAQRVAYVGAVHHGSGAFVGTGSKGGQPRLIRILDRGNVQKPGREVGPGALHALAFEPARFAIDPAAGEGARRAALARWLSDPRNPLTWRSAVNRVWQYHFGRGIVETPNDFGHMGMRPTHPELLDWLAVEFRDNGQSLKRLHRLMVTSAAYRRSTRGDAAAERMDSDNRLLWRQNRRKLEAEAVRDSILMVAGRLDLRMGGPSFQDFVVEKPEHSPHYEYHLHDPEDPASQRRSVYRFIVRSQPQPFLSVMDCADPSMLVGRRNESVSPLQALALLNNALVLSMSRHWAERLEALPGTVESRLDRAGLEALGRPLSAEERVSLSAYARRHGMPNACRVLFNLNEFAFVD
ncbi:MAG: DUF1553 domain-containing protein [Verrucomicrobia bacterium]|nr:MAG: DUF1553 domain-containing protein [Verrucomicrobiota bacterium]